MAEYLCALSDPIKCMGLRVPGHIPQVRRRPAAEGKSQNWLQKIEISIIIHKYVRFKINASKLVQTKFMPRFRISVQKRLEADIYARSKFQVSNLWEVPGVFFSEKLYFEGDLTVNPEI